MSIVARFPIRAILAWAKEVGVDVDSWNSWEDASPQFVSCREAHHFFVVLQTQIPDEPAGLLSGSQCEISALGLAGQIAQHSDTLRQAAQMYLRYENLSNSGCWRLEFDREARLDTIVVTPALDPELEASMEFRITFPFGLALKVFRELVGDPTITAEFVEFVHQDERFRSQYEAYFGAPVRFGCSENRLAFSNDIFERPVVDAVRGTRVYLEKLALTEAKRLSAASAADADFVELVHAQLPEAILAGAFDLASVARRLSVSKRTLQRRLAAQGESFRDLVDGTQERLALELLARSELSTQEIAFKLGYTQVSNFNRAFKRWTGQTPGQIRHVLSQ